MDGDASARDSEGFRDHRIGLHQAQVAYIISPMGVVRTGTQSLEVKVGVTCSQVRGADKEGPTDSVDAGEGRDQCEDGSQGWLH